MGVRGLQTFLEKYCSEACYEVDIGKLAQEHKRRTGEDAKIVVDAQSCYNLWYKGLDWWVGLEVQELVNRLRTFVDNFKQLGIQLIFFFGGLTPDKKRNEWIQRRRRNIKEIHTIFDILKDGGDVPPQYNSIPPNMGLTTSYILKHILLCQVYMSVDEADEEIVDYAYQHNCFALFGQDTDFIVSELNDTIILSSKNFNIKTMTTLRYDREKLAQHLQIRCDQLPLLALLAGNDFIRYDTIKHFHRRLCNIDTPSGMIPYNALMPAIGHYINALPRRRSIEATLERIANDLLRDASEVEVLKMSYSSYFIREARIEIRPEDEWSRILYVAKYRHRMALAPNTVYSIMNDRIFECSTAFEDLRMTHDGNSLPRNQPSSTVTRPLRLRLYGVLLQEKRPPITVQEYCGDNCDSYTEPVVVDPILPTVRHPGLLRMWSDDNSDRLLNCRWELFLTSVHPEIKKRNLQMADNNLFASLCAYYLYKMKFLDVYELDALLATIATFRLYHHRLAHELEYELDYRAAHISVTFIRTFGLILTLLAACGYPIDLCPENAIPNFEGKLFQTKYVEVMKNKKSYRYNHLCEDMEDCKKAFYRMRRFIIPELCKRKDHSKMHNQFSNVQFVQK